jgi:integrase/recombinase XerD
MNLSDACALFLEHCTAAISLSHHTLRAYRCDLADFERHQGLHQRITRIDKEELRQYIRYLREQRLFKESSIKRRLACLKLLFKWLRHEGHLKANPFDTLNERIRLPQRLPRTLDSLDATRLRQSLSGARQPNQYDDLCRQAAVSLLLHTGIRVGELSAIRLSDVSLADRSIRIHGKGNRQRLIYLLSPQLYRHLERYWQRRLLLPSSNDKLFLLHNHLELTPARVRTTLRQLAHHAGIANRITPHMLRHTCATQWLEDGLDIRFVQKLLGHHSISTTEIYTHVSDNSLREALLRVGR